MSTFSWTVADAQQNMRFAYFSPVGVLLAKACGRPGSHAEGNPLGILVLEGTVLFVLCLPIAYAISQFRVQWFFPAMLLVIGGRYLTFSTLYGMRIYWACGAALALTGCLLAASNAAPSTSAFAGAAVEATFAAAIFVAARREHAA